MNVIVFLGFLGMFVMLGSEYWDRVLEHKGSKLPNRFRWWVTQGIGVPVLFWIVSNLGVLDSLPPLLPALAQASSGGVKWFFLVCTEVAPGLALIGSVWASVTFAWLTTLICLHADSRGEFLVMIMLCSVICAPFVWLVFYIGGWPCVGVAGVVWLLPVVHSTMDFMPSKEAHPMYSRAIAKLKFGKYDEAELEVIRQLENHEDDFDGWMLLAELYATRFNDLSGATQVISDLVCQSNVDRIQISIAMHRLADWHLKLREDPDSARTILEELCRHCPEGHIEREARARIEQLPGTKEAFREEQQRKPIRLPALRDTLNSPRESRMASLGAHEAAELANRCVAELTKDPNNVSKREEFARILAEHLGKLDSATGQIELLMHMPGQPDAKYAEWLSLLASWRLESDRGSESARKSLEQLIHRFPTSPQAFAAQRLLSLMEMEELYRKKDSLRRRTDTPRSSTAHAAQN